MNWNTNDMLNVEKVKLSHSNLPEATLRVHKIMDNESLTKYEALELITPVVDDEVSEEKRNAFFEYIAKHEDVRRKYESVKNIKSLMGSRCPSACAPEALRKEIKRLINQRQDPDAPNDSIADNQ